MKPTKFKHKIVQEAFCSSQQGDDIITHHAVLERSIVHL